MNQPESVLPDELAARLQVVRSATRAVTRSAERSDPDGVAEAIEMRGHALAQVGAWFAARHDPERGRLKRRVTAELETSLVEARDALGRMRDSAKIALDALRESRAVRGYADGSVPRQSTALDRAG